MGQQYAKTLKGRVRDSTVIRQARFDISGSAAPGGLRKIPSGRAPGRSSGGAGTVSGSIRGMVRSEGA
jgi:hypothetical protein